MERAGWFTRLLGRKNSTLDLLKEIYGSRAAKSGIDVTRSRAATVTAVLACCRVIAEGVAQIPLKVYRDDQNGGRVEQPREQLHRVLNRKPNGWQTPFEFRETLTLHAALCNNAFAWINRTSVGVAELLPLLPEWVTVKRRADWSIYYEVKIQIDPSMSPLALTIEQRDMLHLRGPSWDTASGLDPVRQAREAIGLALATEEHHALMHANAGRPGGLLSVKGTMTDVQYKRLKTYIEQQLDNREALWRTFLADGEATYTSMAMTGVDSQHLETRRYQVEEICRAFRVFPQMIGFTDKTSTYASAEQFFIAHVVHCIQPWCTRWEQVIQRDLIDENTDLYARHQVQALMRGDAKTRGDFYQRGILSGWLLRSDVRSWEELPPVEGLDTPLQPVNMMVPGDSSDPTSSTPGQDPEPKPGTDA